VLNNRTMRICTKLSMWDSRAVLVMKVCKVVLVGHFYISWSAGSGEKRLTMEGLGQLSAPMV